MMNQPSAEFKQSTDALTRLQADNCPQEQPTEKLALELPQGELSLTNLGVI